MVTLRRGLVQCAFSPGPDIHRYTLTVDRAQRFRVKASAFKSSAEFLDLMHWQPHELKESSCDYWLYFPDNVKLACTFPKDGCCGVPAVVKSACPDDETPEDACAIMNRGPRQLVVRLVREPTEITHLAKAQTLFQVVAQCDFDVRLDRAISSRLFMACSALSTPEDVWLTYKWAKTNNMLEEVRFVCDPCLLRLTSL
eukprot:TRINITY_DN12098_c0_g1_i1.p2 TRINITY_DN12098_c0_g1~~TRINITY_DN12098_c0_g1_i1.p2  ORF type:complete len:198 (+),score=14.51 TRINITY_DN12098_c0_g1_i1:1192-1785(+)